MPRLMPMSLPPGVVPTQDVLSMLGDIRRSLEEVRVWDWGHLEHTALWGFQASWGRWAGDTLLHAMLAQVGWRGAVGSGGRSHHDRRDMGETPCHATGTRVPMKYPLGRQPSILKGSGQCPWWGPEQGGQWG